MWFEAMYPKDAFQPRPGGGMRLHGGKGGNSAPPPDPRLVEAQIRSMGIQDDAIASILSTSAEMAPLQREQLGVSLAAARTANDRGNTLFQQSQEDRTYALGKRAQLSGIQDAIVNESANFNEGDRRAQLVGQGTADVQQAFDGAREQGIRNQARMGVNPNSGRADSMAGRVGLEQALAKVQVGSQATQAARGERLGLQDRANNALAGYPSMSAGSVGVGQGTAGFGLQAGGAGQGAAAQGMQALTYGPGQAAQMAGQMGQNASSMFGQQANYQLNANKANDDSGLWGALGSVAGKALPSLIALSDENEKTGRKPVKPKVALSMARKMPVERWKYKPGSVANDGGKEHIGPMAQAAHKAGGDKLAPGGKVIDLISMNGLTLAAVKALDKKVTKLEKRSKA